MPEQTPRDDDDYLLLKQKAFDKITEENASIIFNGLKRDLLNKIKELAVNNITDVEDFYLLASQFTHCLSYVLAKNKAEQRLISFDEALETIDIEDIVNGLSEHFKNEIEQSYLRKIEEIDEQYKPSKEPWSALQARFLYLYNLLKANEDFKLISLIERSISFLEIEKNKFTECDELDSADHTAALIKNLETFTKNYLIDQDKHFFKNAIKAAIADAKPITEEIRWKRVLNNLARIVISFFSQNSTSSVSFFNNPIKNQITELQTSFSDQISYDS